MNKLSNVNEPTKGRFGARAALFKGVSVLKVLMTMRFLVSCIWVFSQSIVVFRCSTKEKKTHPSSLVFAASYAIRPVLAHLQIRDHIAVRPLVTIDLLSGLDVKKCNLA